MSTPLSPCFTVFSTHTMANSSSQDAEILIHITAPSRTADDVVYRQLAQAYLAFGPQTRIELPLVETLPAQQQPNHETSLSAADRFAISSFDQTFEIGSQDLSFEGVLDNRSSPCIRRPRMTTAVIPSSLEESGAESFSSWCAPPSQISDSYPMPDAGIFNTSPSRILQRFIGRTSSPGTVSLPPSPTTRKKPPISPEQTRAGILSSASTASQEESLQSLPIETPGYARPAKVIPLTPQVPKAIIIVTSSESVEGTATDGPGLDVTHISSSIVSEKSPAPSLAPSPRAGSEPPPTKRHKADHVQHADLVRSSSDTGPVLASFSPILNQLNSSLEIRPPSPPAGVSDVGPPDLVSEKLAKLGTDLSSRYRASSARHIDSFERGYWLLDCAAWSQDARSSAWVFLNNYLRSGLAGWGTWCRRGESHDWIRLYCFGHVVKHTYLLLYLASGRQLKMTGASWFDAAGKMVLEVSPHEKQL